GSGLMDLSIRQPQTGRNRLIERLFADEKVFAAYKKHLQKLVATEFTQARVKKDLAAINAAIGPARQREKKAADARREGGRGFGPFGGGPGNDLEKFVTTRAASIREQLAGKRKGTVPGFGFGPGRFGPAQFLVKPILAAADNDRDGKLSK